MLAMRNVVVPASILASSSSGALHHILNQSELSRMSEAASECLYGSQGARRCFLNADVAVFHFVHGRGTEYSACELSIEHTRYPNR